MKIFYDRYYCSTDGHVYDLVKGDKQLHEYLLNGYLAVRLKTKEKWISVLVPKLVAESFVPKDNPKYNCVYHIDGNKTNNNVENLKWGILGGASIAKKKVILTDNNSQDIYFNSVIECADYISKINGKSPYNIRCNLSHSLNSNHRCYGFKVKYDTGN